MQIQKSTPNTKGYKKVCDEVDIIIWIERGDDDLYLIRL